MSSPPLLTFAYRAMQPDGKVRQGRILASTEAEAYAKLRAEQVSPLELKAVSLKPPTAKTSKGFWRREDSLDEQGLEDQFQGLAVLLKAGADIRTALTVIGSEGVLKGVSQAILGGASLDHALSSVIPEKHSHLRGLIAAGEARGDLPSGLEAAATVMGTRRKIRRQVIEAVSYPAFVFITAIAALLVILLVVVPAIAPLLQETGQDLPAYFAVIVFMSDIVRLGWRYILAALVAIAGLIYLTYRYGNLKPWLSKWALDGPMGGIVRPLIYGGYAKTLGDCLKSGASVIEALRLCQRSVSNAEAKVRLEPVMTLIRQGRSLSEAIRAVKDYPKSIVRLCEVGEASSTLGEMLSRAGYREEQLALATIDRLSKLLGPALLIALGAIIGGLMAGVLSALTDIGAVSRI